MKLYIDTSDLDKIVIGLDGERFEKRIAKRKSELLNFIDEKLKVKGKNIDDIKEVEVNIGPGSFTGLRIGLTVAKTIGWDKNILVNGKLIRKNGSVVPKYK